MSSSKNKRKPDNRYFQKPPPSIEVVDSSVLSAQNESTLGFEKQASIVSDKQKHSNFKNAKHHRNHHLEVSSDQPPPRTDERTTTNINILDELQLSKASSAQSSSQNPRASLWKKQPETLLGLYQKMEFYTSHTELQDNIFLCPVDNYSQNDARLTFQDQNAFINSSQGMQSQQLAQANQGTSDLRRFKMIKAQSRNEQVYQDNVNQQPAFNSSTLSNEYIIPQHLPNAYNYFSQSHLNDKAKQNFFSQTKMKNLPVGDFDSGSIQPPNYVNSMGYLSSSTLNNKGPKKKLKKKYARIQNAAKEFVKEVETKCGQDSKAKLQVYSTILAIYENVLNYPYCEEFRIIDMISLDLECLKETNHKGLEQDEDDQDEQQELIKKEKNQLNIDQREIINQQALQQIFNPREEENKYKTLSIKDLQINYNSSTALIPSLPQESKGFKSLPPETIENLGMIASQETIGNKKVLELLQSTGFSFKHSAENVKDKNIKMSLINSSTLFL